MVNFTGEYFHSIDAKGRLAVPAKFREALGSHFVVTKGLDGNLYLYTMEDWESFVEKLRAIPMLGKENRQFVRFVLAGAQEVETDKLGRILLSPALREYAALEKDIVSIGVGSRAEIWSKDRWEDDQLGCDPSSMESHMVDLGIHF